LQTNEFFRAILGNPIHNGSEVTDAVESLPQA
jgi:hypothetical protein